MDEEKYRRMHSLIERGLEKLSQAQNPNELEHAQVRLVKIGNIVLDYSSDLNNRKREFQEYRKLIQETFHNYELITGHFWKEYRSQIKRSSKKEWL